ncbi:MFS transporter [Salipaludibacillus neizhouensis]|uniref:MFS transporter n=1 Tax=Salipaludibacillus neizhouensis TaxID=885475 RepID=A0A3A9K0H6_9BACI|nr:MFS transporter [Salipaludibacillus neizhouensis]RKL64708.1 MFS transporter [Salipaludibacillus neizhouensis]
MDSKRLIMVGLPMIAVTYGFARFSYGLVLPYIRESLDINPSEAGVISSLSYLAYCIAIIMAMLYMQKVGSRMLILIAGITAAMGMGIISMANDSISLGIGIFIAGLSTGLSSPPYADVIKKWVDQNKRSPTNTWINAGTSLGTALTGIMVIFLGTNWRLTYLLFTLIAFIILILNYKVIPKTKDTNKNRQTQAFHVTKKDVGNAYPLILSSLLLGITCAAYWTFSRDFLLQMENIPEALTQGFWIIIGIAGVLGGFAGYFSSKIGLLSSYRVSVIFLGTSSLLLGLSTSVLPVVISAIFFGSSYIFMTGVLIIWGINIFKTNSSFGLGLPFLLLALGQGFGSLIGGMVAEFIGYEVMFTVFAMISFIALIFKPKK